MRVRALLLSGVAVLAVLLALGVPASLRPLALVVLPLCAGYAIVVWPRPTGESLEWSLRSLLLVPVLVGLLLPAAAGLVAVLSVISTTLSQVDPGGAWLVATSVALILTIGILIARRWPERWPDWAFLTLASTAILVFKLAWHVQVQVEPSSDFAGMWRLAGAAASGELASLGAGTEHLTYLHFERTLPYLLPLRFLLGESRWAYVLPNSVLTVGCSLLTYALGRRLLSPRAGRIAFAVSALAVEPTLASGIPTHDLPGSLFTLASFLALLQADNHARGAPLKKALFSGLLLGLLLLVADLQRNNLIFFLAALLLYLAADLFLDRVRTGTGMRPLGRRVAFTVLVPVLVVVAGNAVLRASGIRMPPETHELWSQRALAAHSDSWGSGRQRQAVDEYYDRFDLTASEWRKFGRRKLLSDLAFNLEPRLATTLRRSKSLFSLGRQLGFYLNDARSRSGHRLSAPLRQTVHLANLSFAGLFLAMFLAGTLHVWRRPRFPLVAYLPALYLAATAGPIVVLFQPQARYMLQIWYLGALYVGARWSGRGGAGETGTPQGAVVVSKDLCATPRRP